MYATNTSPHVTIATVVQGQILMNADQRTVARVFGTEASTRHRGKGHISCGMLLPEIGCADKILRTGESIRLHSITFDVIRFDVRGVNE